MTTDVDDEIDAGAVAARLAAIRSGDFPEPGPHARRRARELLAAYRERIVRGERRGNCEPPRPPARERYRPSLATALLEVQSSGEARDWSDVVREVGRIRGVPARREVVLSAASKYRIRFRFQGEKV